MNLFLDTNILIDLAADRSPFSKWAILIFRDAKKGRWKLFTSSLSILTTYYIIEKEVGKSKSKRIIKILLNRLEIIDLGKAELLTAITSNFIGYEDAVQHECAKLCKNIDCIVTRNKKDLKHSVIEVVSSEELYI